MAHVSSTEGNDFGTVQKRLWFRAVAIAFGLSPAILRIINEVEQHGGIDAEA
jgi:hypothetical protein